MNYPMNTKNNFFSSFPTKNELPNGRWTILPTDRFAIHCGWTDRNPFEIIRVISNKTIEIREMKTTLSNNWKPIFERGGFGGHCVNAKDQEWDIEPLPNMPIFRIRRSSKRGKPWRDKYGLQYSLSEYPYKYYDYNF